MEKLEKYVDLKSYLATQKEELGNDKTFEAAEAYFCETANSIKKALAKLENAALSELEKRYYKQVIQSCWESTRIAKSLSKSNCTVEQILDVLGDRREYIDRIRERAGGVETPPGDEYLVAVIKYWEKNLPFEMLKRLKDEVKNIADLKNISDTSKGTLLTLLYSAIDSCSCREACACYSELCLNIPEGLKTGKELGRHASSLWNAVYGNIKLEEEKRQVELAVEKERANNKVWRDVTHHIKNLSSSVCVYLKDLECPEGKKALNAIRRIQELSSRVFYVTDDEKVPWWRDVIEPTGYTENLEAIIHNAMEYAIAKIFDVTIHDDLVSNYFGGRIDKQARIAYNNAKTTEDLVEVIREYFFDFKQIVNGDLKVPIGNTYKTANILFYLFYELFLNAVKYSSYTEKSRRFINISVDISDAYWNFTIENSAEKNTRNHGGGVKAIEDLSRVFNAQYESSFANNTYKSTIIFNVRQGGDK